MTTQHPRVNVTFEQATVGLLTYLAEQKCQSIASIVRELTIEALEMHEDFHLSELAKKLDKSGVKTYSHRDAWK